jgi:hypothetical protein
MTTTILQNAFLPTQISSCTLWLDAADPNATGVLPANGATVSTWRDKSSTANNFTGSATYTLDSVYNKYGLSFNGSTNYFSQVNGSLYSITNTTYTIFTVHRFYFDNPSNSIGNVYRRAGGGAFFFRQFVGGAVQWITDTDPAGYIQVSGTAASLSGIGCINTITTTSATAYLNGTSVGSGARSTTTNIAFVIGYSSVSELLQGAIFEMIIYNTTITTAQRQQVEGYLAAKWGLQSSLPATHPYKYGIVTTLPSVSTIISQNGINRFNNALFLPTSIPGCKLWFDATDTTSIFSDTGGTTQITQGGSVARWNDKSGNNNYLQQATSGSRPVYQNTPGGYSGLYFVGQSKQLTTINNNPVTGNSSRTVFLIQQSPNSGATRVGTGPNNGSFSPPTSFGLDNNTVTSVVYCPYVYAGADNTISASVRTLAEIWAYYDSSVSQLGGNYDFSDAQKQSTTLNTTATTWYFGLRPDGGGSIDSYFCEFILYDTALTTAQRQQIEGYLAWKWGLVSNLPLSHPYKAAPFTPFSAIVSVASLLNTNQLNSKLITTFFNPTSIAGCVLWLDGGDTSPASMTLSGRTVTTWKDKSGNGYNATSANNPQLVSSGGVSFNAVLGQYFSLSSPFASTHAVFIVATTSPASQIYLFGRNFPSSAPTILLNYVGSSLEYYDGGTSGRQTIATTTTPTYIAAYLRTFNTSVVGRYNGSQVFTEAGPTSEATYLGWGSLGCSSPSYGNFYTGTIYEFLIYNTSYSLTVSQAQQIEGYLSWKWGLQANLPSTHPYKVFPPPPN